MNHWTTQLVLEFSLSVLRTDITNQSCHSCPLISSSEKKLLSNPLYSDCDPLINNISSTWEFMRNVHSLTNSDLLWQNMVLAGCWRLHVYQNTRSNNLEIDANRQWDWQTGDVLGTSSRSPFHSNLRPGLGIIPSNKRDLLLVESTQKCAIKKTSFACFKRTKKISLFSKCSKTSWAGKTWASMSKMV